MRILLILFIDVYALCLTRSPLELFELTCIDGV